MIRTFLTCQTLTICLETVCSDRIKNLSRCSTRDNNKSSVVQCLGQSNASACYRTSENRSTVVADDTILFAANEETEVEIIQSKIVMGSLFHGHQLNSNATKPEFDNFSRKSKIQKKKYEQTVSNQNLSHIKTIKHLGILSDENLIYQLEF